MMRTPASALLIFLASGAAFALSPEDCSFYAPFDGGCDASQARGSAKAVVKGEFRFVPGVRGQAILVGAPETGLSYQTKGNLDLEAGTVSVWVKPETWDDTDASMRFFFGVTEADPSLPQDGGTFLWLYHYFSRSTYFLVWDTRGYPTLCSQDAKQFLDVFKKGEWVHLVGTWNGDEIRLYINGKLQGSTRVSTPRLLRSLGARFTVGDPNQAKAADTVLDEFRLFGRALTPPEVEALHRFQLDATPSQQELTVVPLPGAKKVRVDVNAIARRPSDAANLTATVTLRSQSDRQRIGEQTCRFTGSQHSTLEFGTERLAAGRYLLTSSLTETGKELAATEAPFSVNPPPKWLGSRVGLSDKVPAPWTPLLLVRTAQGATVKCWGPRRYRLGEALFPTELVTLDHSLLAGPIGLSGSVNGTPLRAQGTRTTWGKSTPARIELTSTCAAGAATLTTESFLEYDGLLWVRLKLSAKTPLRVSNLALEVPLRKEAATLIQTGSGPEDTGAIHAYHHRANANAQVWLGNEDGGLQCTIPAVRCWRNADVNRQIEVLPEADRVVLRLNLVDREATFPEGAEYELGLQLTPVRPHPPGWRRWRITPLDDTPGTRFNPFFTEGWCLGTSYPIPKPEWERICNEATARGDRATLYLQPFTVWPGLPDYPDFAAGWRTRYCSAPPPFDPQAPPSAMVGVCPRLRSWGDYFVTTFCDLMEGRCSNLGWGAVYFDVTQTPVCDNADHGCGYRDEYGVWQPEQRYLEHREVQRRFYVALRERWPDRPLFNHESGTPDMTQLAFCEGMIDGEHLTGALPGTSFNYHSLLTLDRMRAEYMGHNFGFVPIFLPEFTRAGEGNAEVTARFLTNPEPPEVMHLLGLLMLHDILPWNAYSNPGPYFHWWAVQDAFGWDDEVEFLPYWKNRDLATLSPADPNVVCTLYRRPGKLLLVLMNNTDEDREVTVALSAAKLGLPGLAESGLLDAWQAASFRYPTWNLDPATKQAVRAPEPVRVTGKEQRVPVQGGRLTLPVPKRSFRLLSAP